MSPANPHNLVTDPVCFHAFEKQVAQVNLRTIRLMLRQDPDSLLLSLRVRTAHQELLTATQNLNQVLPP
jgi:hypothetical protein